MDLSNFQRRAIIFIFSSILIGSILLVKKEPLKEKEIIIKGEQVSTPQISPLPTKIDINTADISSIMKLPGIGPVLAQEIIRHRPYKNLDDLLNVPGIGERRLDRIKEMIDLPEGEKCNEEVREDNQGPTLSTSTADSIDLNKASVEQLLELPGIGPVLAHAIIDYREEHNRFNSIEELMEVHGIGEKVYGKIKRYLYVEDTEEVQREKVSDIEEKTQQHIIYDSRIDPKVRCPYCGRQMWEKGKRRQRYIRCPHCLKLLDE